MLYIYKYKKKFIKNQKMNIEIIEMTNQPINLNQNNKLMKRTYIKKDGSLVEKQYNQQPYNSNFYQKHKEKYTEKYICEICNSSLSRTNKYNHLKSQKHLLYVDINNNYIKK
jgi:uncharacterized protein with PIN domain